MRPAGYGRKDWIVCGECRGSGIAEYIGGYARPCDGCNGAGGWPSNAKRFDDEEEATDRLVDKADQLRAALEEADFSIGRELAKAPEDATSLLFVTRAKIRAVLHNTRNSVKKGPPPHEQ